MKYTNISSYSVAIRYVIKLADNEFTFPEKIMMWQRTAEEYIAFGYYCPKILCDKTGGFLTVDYKERRCFAYAEEYAKYSPLEERNSDESENICSVYDTKPNGQAPASRKAPAMMFIGAVEPNAVPLEYFGIAKCFSVFAAVGFTATLGVYLFTAFRETKRNKA